MLPTDQEVTSEDEGEVFRKWQKHVLRCKEAASRRFHHKYLVALRERHNLNHKDKHADIHIGEVVIIKGESKNRGHWKLSIVEKSSWITNDKKLSRTTNAVIVPNGITLQYC